MTPKAIFTKYLKDLADVSRQGDAREESFYPVLAAMLNEVAVGSGKKQVRVTVLPRPTEGGNPDFRLWNGSVQIGYIEAKKPSLERLNDFEKTEQLQRYLNTFPNLNLTNFLEFRLYRNGKRIETVCLGQPFVLNTLGQAPPLKDPDKLHCLLSRFLDFALPPDFFVGKGETTVAKTKADGFYYDPNSERKYVNKAHYFGPIPENVYEYRIGGYQVCDRWLKDRKGRRLDDFRTYCMMVTAIGKTIEIQKELDTLYSDVEKDLVTIEPE